MTIAQYFLIAAALLAAGAVYLSRPRGYRLTELVFPVGFVLALGAWPMISGFIVAPLIWDSPSASGGLFATMQVLPTAAFAGWAFVRALVNGKLTLNLTALILATLLPVVGVFVATGDASIFYFAAATVVLLGVVLHGEPKITLDQVALGCRLSIATMLVCFAVLATFWPSSVLLPCPTFKCSILNQVLTVQFTSGNYGGIGNLVGIFLVLLLPFALARIDVKCILLLASSVLLAGVVAGSRTALIAFVIAAVVPLAARLRPSIHVVVAWCAFAGALIFSMLPLYYPYRGTSFTLRGYLWDRAKQLITENPIVGHGPGFWRSQGDSAVFQANYSAHNIWLDVAVSVGLLGIAVIVIAVGYHIAHASQAMKPYLVGYYATVLALCAFESVYVPYYLGIAPIAALLPLLADYRDSTTASPEEVTLTEFQPAPDMRPSV
ncbi:O-antigen ligase family protein [Skermania sp. ID1734]|uniref:O-antigen ligase family protein n=1 Tax=Skermania sp. ID1734 TaxID=2597516 RepID=UPI00117CC008|nr:O-antigen ligase family protein [Skermania sp. ID1734]TSD93178.1 O-antigen ligase family protein [Skermania sp. ID1734]